MQSGIISSNKSEKFNSFISSWGDINISTKNSKACIKTIQKANPTYSDILEDYLDLVPFRNGLFGWRVPEFKLPVGFNLVETRFWNWGELRKVVGWKGFIGILAVKVWVGIGERKKELFWVYS